MLGSCFSSVPQEDDKCIVDANSLLSETFCTSSFCLANGDCEVLEGERFYLVVQGLPVLRQEVTVAQQSDRFGRLFCHMTEHMI
jgi:hypothetical protein